MDILETLRLGIPFVGFSGKNISQLFGVNHEYYSQNFNGLLGHNGVDLVNGPDGYGTQILATHDGLVYIVSLDASQTKGMGVYLQKILSDGTLIQTVYWHLSKVNVISGQQVKQGEVIGEMGNTGNVRPLPSAQNPHAGTHTHFALAVFRGGKPLYTDYIYGFVDPLPYLLQPGDKIPFKLQNDLYQTCTYYNSNLFDQVSLLQTMLKIGGYAGDYIPIGSFGGKTRRDVSLLQAKVGIDPTLGYVGPKTRTYLNSKYSMV